MQRSGQAADREDIERQAESKAGSKRSEYIGSPGKQNTGETLRMSAGAKQDFATCVGKCAAYMWVSEWGAGVVRQSSLISDCWQLCDWCNGGWECVSAVHDGRCSPWVMCSCSVVRGNQIRDSWSCGWDRSLVHSVVFSVWGMARSALYRGQGMIQTV